MFLWQIRKYERKTRNVQKQNICMVAICLTQRAQRTQRFNSPYCSRWRWRGRKFHCDGRAQRQDGKRIYYIATDYWHTSAFSCRAKPATSQAIMLYSKSLRSLRALRAETKHLYGGYCLTQRAQRGRFCRGR